MSDTASEYNYNELKKNMSEINNILNNNYHSNIDTKSDSDTNSSNGNEYDDYADKENFDLNKNYNNLENDNHNVNLDNLGYPSSDLKKRENTNKVIFTENNSLGLNGNNLEDNINAIKSIFPSLPTKINNNNSTKESSVKELFSKINNDNDNDNPLNYNPNVSIFNQSYFNNNDDFKSSFKFNNFEERNIIDNNNFLKTGGNDKLKSKVTVTKIFVASLIIFAIIVALIFILNSYGYNMELFSNSKIKITDAASIGGFLLIIISLGYYLLKKHNYL